MTEEDRLTYSDAGVDIDESEAATDALLAAFGSFDTDAYAGLLEVGDSYIALATDGVGTKLLVAEALGQYDTIGIDCIAMNVNDLVAMGVEPIGFVDYLAIESPDDNVTAAIGEGLAQGAAEADVALLGGETAVLPEIVRGFDLAGACVGVADADELLDTEATPGDHLVGLSSSGIHSNGLTLARKATTRDHAYTDPFPPDPERSIGEVLLEPTALYTAALPHLRAHARAAAHITGGGWTNLGRLGSNRYVIDTPQPVPPIFDFIQAAGAVTDTEMYRTYNMGTGFVAAVPAESSDTFVEATGGSVIGYVEEGDSVDIRGISLAVS